MEWSEEWTGHAIAIAFILVGFLLTGVGQKFFSGFLGIAGAVSFGFLGAWLGHTYLYQFQWWLWILTLIIGAAFGFIVFWKLRILALCIVGFGSGLLLGILGIKIIEASTNGFGGNQWFCDNGWIMTAGLGGAVGAGASLWLEVALLIFSTSVLGSWATVLGIDHFIKNNEFTRTILGRGTVFKLPTVGIVLFSVWGALTLLGFIVQTTLWFLYGRTPPSDEGLELYEPLDTEANDAYNNASLVSGHSGAGSSAGPGRRYDYSAKKPATLNHYEEESKWNPKTWFKKKDATAAPQGGSDVQRIRDKYGLNNPENEKARAEVRAKYGLK